MTRAVIASFVARDVAGSMALEWVTASEIGTVGFYLKRWEEGEGKYVDVNERLIRSLVTPPRVASTAISTGTSCPASPIGTCSSRSRPPASG